jgi:UDP-N-acetylmuramoylalanine--D-glutamate ligase
MLNIAEDHLDRHGSMETYEAVKRRIFARQTETQTSLLNWDDERCRRIAEDLCSHVAWFSRYEPVSTGAYLSQNGELTIKIKDAACPVCHQDEVRLPGAHNLENALAAVAIGSFLGVPPAVIRHTLRTFPGVEHRLETVRVLEGVSYINDSKGTNVHATAKAIEAMSAPTVMIVGGCDENNDLLPLAQCICAHPLIQHVVLIGETAAKIAMALDSVRYKEYVFAEGDMEAALLQCRMAAKPGWNVLLSPACASFDMFRDFEHRGSVFKKIVNDL